MDARGTLLLPGPRSRLGLALAVLGAVAVVVGLLVAPQRTGANLLLASQFLLGIGLGGVFFLALHSACGARWASALLTVPCAMSALLPVGAAGMVALLLVRPGIYPWLAGGPGEAHALSGFQALWLDRTFFLARSVLYLALWIGIGRALARRSLAAAGFAARGPAAPPGRLSALFLVVFALTFSAASFDWIMALEPEWTSTIFAVYNFAGMFVSALAVMILLSVWLQRRGPFRDVLTADHLHDLGKLLFAFSTFWMYIWFSQYMLIWYANIPEETAYFVARLRGAWAPLFVLNFFVNWVVPFFALLSRHAKRNPALLVQVALLVLLGRWLDLYLMILPSVETTAPGGPWELGLAAGAAGALLLVLPRTLDRSPSPVARSAGLRGTLPPAG
ncbi:MAG: hypothetical protein AB1726_00575 [Planctomycetota bacterium]